MATFSELAARFEAITGPDDVACREIESVSAAAYRLLTQAVEHGRFSFADYGIEFGDHATRSGVVGKDRTDYAAWQGTCVVLSRAGNLTCTDPNVMRWTAKGVGHGTGKDWRARAANYAEVCRWLQDATTDHSDATSFGELAKRFEAITEPDDPQVSKLEQAAFTLLRSVASSIDWAEFGIDPKVTITGEGGTWADFRYAIGEQGNVRNASPVLVYCNREGVSSDRHPFVSASKDVCSWLQQVVDESREKRLERVAGRYSDWYYWKRIWDWREKVNERRESLSREFESIRRMRELGHDTTGFDLEVRRAQYVLAITEADNGTMIRELWQLSYLTKTLRPDLFRLVPATNTVLSRPSDAELRTYANQCRELEGALSMQAIPRREEREVSDNVEKIDRIAKLIEVSSNSAELVAAIRRLRARYDQEQEWFGESEFGELVSSRGERDELLRRLEDAGCIGPKRAGNYPVDLPDKDGATHRGELPLVDDLRDIHSAIAAIQLPVDEREAQAEELRRQDLERRLAMAQHVVTDEQRPMFLQLCDMRPHLRKQLMYHTQQDDAAKSMLKRIAERLSKNSHLNLELDINRRSYQLKDLAGRK